MCALSPVIGLLLISSIVRADNKDEVAKLVKDMKATDANVRRSVVVKLGALGTDAAKPLCGALLDKDTKVREAFASLEKAAPRLYKHVSTMELDGTFEERQKAIEELGKLGADARPALRLLITRGKESIAKADEQKRNTNLSTNYMKAIADTGGDEQVTADFFMAATYSIHGDIWGPSLDWCIAWAGDKEARRKQLVPFIKAGMSDQSEAIIPFTTAAGTIKANDLLPHLKKTKLSSYGKVRDAAVDAIDAPLPFATAVISPGRPEFGLACWSPAERGEGG